MKRYLPNPEHAASCYFRSSVTPPLRKALIQITERCDLRCAHCFVSATRHGIDMQLDDIRHRLIPQLLQSRVCRVTLTGGEPLLHPELIEIVRSLREHSISVGLCTNGYGVGPHLADRLAQFEDVHVNVSLDGFSAASHGKFRGRLDAFEKTRDAIVLLASRRLLQGILVTPNSLAQPEEYTLLCDFASSVGAKYVLMNPLSALGRGVHSQNRLAADREIMRQIESATSQDDRGVEVVHIRFPNESRPLAGCEAGNIFYVFANGETAICPYLVFAARTAASQHNAAEFIVGNAFTDTDLATRLDEYQLARRLQMGQNIHCTRCGRSSGCGKGCPAAVVASGKRIGELDSEVCPEAAESHRATAPVQQVTIGASEVVRSEP